eukprot:scpid53464/ scgid5812/ Junction-mediating and -regulatory protein
MEVVEKDQVRTDSSCDELVDDWLAIKTDAFAMKSDAMSDGADGQAEQQGSEWRVSVSQGPTLSQVVLQFVNSAYDGDDSDEELQSQAASEASTVDTASADVSDDSEYLNEVCTFCQLEERHSALSTLYPPVECILPRLPREPAGFWSYFASIQVDSDIYIELEKYFAHVIRFCGVSVLKEIFFATEDDSANEYMEEVGELKRKRLVEAERQDLEALEGVYELHAQVTDIDNLAMWHSFEDKAIADAERSERKLFKFSCRPFSTLQEMASFGRDQALQRSLDDDLPLAARAEAAHEEDSLTQDMIESRVALLQLESTLYQSIASRTEKSIKLMLADKDEMCRSVAREKEWCGNGMAARLHLLERKFVTCSVDLLRVHCRQLQVQKEQVLLDIASLTGSVEEDQETVHKQEKLFYELHLNLLETHMALLDEKGKQIKFWLEDLPPSDSRRKQQLLAQEASLSTRKSRRRVEKKICEKNAKELKLDLFSHEKSTVAQTAVSKIQEVREFEAKHLEEERRKSHRKALGRVKEYRTKNYKPPEVLPPRYQPPSLRNSKPPRQKTANPSTSSILASSMSSLRVGAPKAALVQQQAASRTAAAGKRTSQLKSASAKKSSSAGKSPAKKASTSSKTDKSSNAASVSTGNDAVAASPAAQTVQAAAAPPPPPPPPDFSLASSPAAC